VSDRELHLSLYRRWRPQRFADVVNQEEIVRTLRNAISAGEEAHAYLFAGERGIGKTSIARILARAVNCLDASEGEPCNACGNCEVILSSRTLDIVEIDGASNRGIDHIRRLREEVNFSPTDLKKKVYIIDEVHMLTNEAFNALLKTLEEPPPHALFVFATTEPHKVPRTILSRCQAFEFRRILPGEIAKHLAVVAEAEKVRLTPEALELIAQRADGGMRDALVMLEQAMSFEKDEVTLDTVLDMLGLVGRETHQSFLDALLANDRVAALATIDSLVERGKDLESFLGDTIRLVRGRLAAGGADRDIALIRGLLDVKADLFRALDRTIRLEVGVLELMAQLSGSGQKGQSAKRQTAASGDREGATREAKSVAEPLERISEAPEKKREAEPRSAMPAETHSPFPSGDVSEAHTQEPLSGPVAAVQRKPVERTAPALDPALETTWQGMLDEIGRERIAIAAFLTECRPTLVNERLTFHFHPMHTFHKESLEKGANLQYLAGAARRHFGDAVVVDIAYDPGVEPKPTPRELLREKAQLVCQVFDGKIVKEDL